MSADHSSSIASYLNAYTAEDVRKALKIYAAKVHKNLKLLKERSGEEEAPWQDFSDAPPTEEIIKGLIEEKLDWRIVNGKVQTRKSGFNAQSQGDVVEIEHSHSNPSKQKTDLSMKPTDKVCPLCGEVMAWEPICPGCKLGRQGFKGRYVCMADFDHTYYMLREGLDLPNR